MGSGDETQVIRFRYSYPMGHFTSTSLLILKEKTQLKDDRDTDRKYSKRKSMASEEKIHLLSNAVNANYLGQFYKAITDAELEKGQP